MLSMAEVEERLDIWGNVFHFWELDEHGHQILWNLNIGGMHFEFIPKVMVMTWLTMILVALFAIVATRNMDMRRPRGVQNVFEMMFEGIRNLVNQNMDPQKGAGIIGVVITFFIFILFSNILGLVPTLSSPTANPNTTFALSLTTFALMYYYGLKYKGAGYFKHFVTPYVFFLPINLIEEFSKPVTLAFRLYGNIYGGEVMLIVLLGLFGMWADLLGGFIASVVWLAFSIFVGCIQAFIFTMLSIVYISIATADH
ncbi:F0F1 ATP synthase subunit A [Pelotomaculum terephthalicicum JT]|uniref:F0F1 ATP synthase subunit A n=1 Tax=Pelotomaculum TaxID=191373 RepID=UPI0009C7F4D6|nr:MULTISPECIES: F0F1 ATP synthase subunit A [Pelotomaculum]MCG9967920.1 F0F1 ATP synthase subunit A [Pelotomaculum terephthalicicum JT]OPX90950.1 MAG: ATP synthase subunit a [Pelotomaculum sp. PtaB.Bin117]OPY62497.1 MAG: ATP synthase subunit a [Pelotomaculum sp. PtaU1.Bin065]